MADGQHCFISYSHRDADDFGPQLAYELEGGTPYIDAWFDKRDILPGETWDKKVPDAIKACKCLLFVMTKDSVSDKSVCADELDLALRYKKPILILRLCEDIEPPFRLAKRQWIDFCSHHKAGMARLIQAIQHLDSPEGQLEILQDRLANAKRDLSSAKTEVEKSRAQVDVDDLKKQVEAQQKIVDNPKAAEEQTKKNIEAGLERERNPEKPVAAKSFTKFINPPPGIAPNYFQDRYDETKEILRFLNDDAQRLMTIVGRGGVGKTAMVCRLLKGLEGGELPDGLGNMRVEGIVYLSESGSHRVNFANLFYDLCKLLPADAANALDAVYKNPQASTASKMSALLDRFTAGKVVLLLDNVEPLISVETFDIADVELDECLRALLHGAHSALKVILTTRVAPRGLNLCEPGRQRVLTLDSGLEQKYAVEMLREMDVDGKLGLKSAAPEALKRAYERTLGFPRALEALFAILASDRYTTLDELLAMPTPVNVVEALVGEAFNRLDTNAQKVMQALAVYNRPVTPAAVDYLLAPHLPAIDSVPILQRLANMHFARKESGRFYLHPVDREFAFGLIPENDLTTKDTKVTKDFVEEEDSIIKVEPDDVIPASDATEDDSSNDSDIDFESLFASWRASQHNAFTQHDLTSRAADYFRQARKLRAEWKKLDDLSAQLAEFDLRCAAGDYDTAASVLTEIDYDYLGLWGHYSILIRSYDQVARKVVDKNIARSVTGNLGWILSCIGQVGKAIEYYEKALNMAKESKNRQAEETWLGALGAAYQDVGNLSQSIKCLEEALAIAREIGDHKNESAHIGNLGNSYTELGNARKAIELFEQGLIVAREIGSRSNEGDYLNNLGNCYANLGDVKKAIEFYEQALVIAREIGEKPKEGSRLGNLGNRYAALGDTYRAIELYEQSLAICSEIGNRRGASISLDCTGNAFLTLEDYQKAKENYQQAIQIADEISFPQTQNYARCGLAQAYLIQNDLKNARATIEAALQYDVPQNNHNVSALHGIILLRMRDLTGLTESHPNKKGSNEDLSGLAAAAFLRAIGQADEILSKTAEYYSALDAKGLAVCGLALCRGAAPLRPYAQEIADAIETFRKARKIAPHAGVVKSVLRLFDELAKCDEENVLEKVRDAIEGKNV